MWVRPRSDRLLRAFTIAVAAVATLAGGPGRGVADEPAIRIEGSGYTMPQFTSPWVQAFNARGGPQVALARGGTNSGPPALLAGRAQIASMTRPFNASEREAFRRKHGREPVAIPVAADALAVFVHADNPLERLTLPQLDAIFSTTRKCGASADVSTWSGVGLDGEYAARRIGLYGRRPRSGTADFFRTVALCDGQFKETLRVGPGPRFAAQSIAAARFGIGFASRADVVPGTRTLALARKAGEPFATIDPADVYAGAYPLARQLYFYIEHPKGEALDPALLDFLRFALSPEAQRAVEIAGYLPVPRKLAERTLTGLR
ncbi:MAG: PstS family phosphate ABC transporter substrate-binding protein [Deltaproteobacteria bacterium]|nr:PstS family phosphate ABC transporter substrate-binding protein [Deltaproteobacteria bacterium]MBW2416485.1 PstS family phosphate ABC transporter substrate-binding protein [Deltaproteobacteria bacterium]